ncbi:MAG TPA: DUF2934 domain-containing protein [Terriglobales bacterium]|jgi:hypothetical protein|nr:DUF2934 domain-containing protein [Terriglobales bacterium]
MPRAKTPRTPKPKAEKAENKVLQMPETVALANGNGNGNHVPTDIETEIRRRAYELYEGRGYADGQAEQDWIQAEREVLARQSQKHTA